MSVGLNTCFYFIIVPFVSLSIMYVLLYYQIFLNILLQSPEDDYIVAKHRHIGCLGFSLKRTKCISSNITLLHTKIIEI